MAIHENFSLVEGGPLYRLGLALGGSTARGVLTRLALVFALATWVPVFALNALGNSLTGGSTVPFVQSLGTHVRLLVAIPLFFIAEYAFNRRVRQVIASIVETRLVRPGQVPLLDAVLHRVTRWRQSWIAEAAILAGAFVLIASGVRADLPTEMSTWRTQGGHFTTAGWWYTFVSLPAFQFLFWRWVVQLLLWGYVLWAIARLDLELTPTHPDSAGGLGIFGVAQLSLAPLACGAVAMLVAGYAERILYGNARLAEFGLPIAAAVVGATLFVVAPLTLFTARLMKAKQLGLIEYGALAARYVRGFDRKWLRDAAPPDQDLLGSADIQSLADMSGAFEVVQGMRVVPIALSQIVLFLTLAALPAAPLILLVIPLDELILQLFKTILHL
jgi:hypothetical protein